MKYDKEISFLLRTEEPNNTLNQRNKITREKLLELKLSYPNLSESYLSYLEEIGEGYFRECQYKVSGSLFIFEDVGLGEAFDTPPNIKFFGDDNCGDFAGFDLSNEKDEVIEFWHDSQEIFYTGKTFHEYIREQMLMDENGNEIT